MIRAYSPAIVSHEFHLNFVALFYNYYTNMLFKLSPTLAFINFKCVGHKVVQHHLFKALRVATLQCCLITLISYKSASCKACAL